MIAKECCEACRFSVKIEPGAGTLGGLVCRRHPPTPILVLAEAPRSLVNIGGGMVPVLKAYHAPVSPEQWCGEFESSIAAKLGAN